MNETFNGSYAWYAYGSGGAYGNKWINNTLTGYYYYGLYSYYQYDVEINGNTILQSPNGYTYNYPIYSYYNDGAIKIINNYIYDNAGSSCYGLYVNYPDATAAAPGLIANNMIAMENMTSTCYGLRVYNGMHQNIYNNSVSGESSGTMYAGYIYLSNTTSYGPYNFMNNSIANFGTSGYCLYGYGSGLAGITFSNNNLYTNGSNLCYFSSYYTDVNAFNTATGGNDISYDPEYLSASDLHTFSLNLNAAGTPVPEVTDDIDGDLRDPMHPDIGADEFNLLLPANELAVQAMYTLGHLPLGAGDEHVVKAIVRNMGNDTQYNVPVTLTITGANTFTDVFTIDSIPFADIDTIYFNPFTATTIGVNDVTVTLPMDMDSTNNQASYWQNVNNIEIAYKDTSASVVNLGYGTGQGMLLCKYHINGAKLIESVGAYIVGNTTTGNSLYGIVLDEQGNLLSETSPVTITTVDSTYQFPVLDPGATNTVNADVYVGIVQTWGSAGYYPLGVQEEDPARWDAYYVATTVGTPPTEDASFGRFMISARLSDPPPFDAACNAITAPVGGCGLGMEDVTIEIQNMGSSAIVGNNLTVYYQLNNNTPVSETLPAATVIQSAATHSYTFSTQVDLAVLFDSTFTLTAWTDLTSDTYATNDSAMTIIESLYQPATPSAVNTTVLYGSMATLSVLSSDSIFWFDDPLLTNNVGNGPDITIGPLYDTTSMWALASTLSTGDIQLGTGTSTTATTTYPNPYCTWYYGNKEQFLIRAEELIALGFTAGNIHSVAFNCAGVSSQSMTNFEMKIGTTADMSLTSFQSGLTSVWFNPNFTPVLGWNVHEFTVPFAWDGISNVVIETCFNNGSYTSGGSIQYTPTSFTSCYNYHADNSTVCSATSGTTYSNRPNMVFNVEVPGCLTPPVEVIAYVANIPANDIGVVTANSPMSGTNLTSSEIISVDINNWGSLDASLFQISYEITGTVASSATEFFTGTIPSGTSATFDFLTTVDFSLYGIYDICVYTQLVGDGFPVNDTLCFQVVNSAPVFCSSGATSTAYEEIVQVDLSNMSNYSFPSGAMYTNFNNTVTPASLILGNSHPISITSDYAPGYTTNYNCWVEVYIDWDNDGSYTEPGEIAYSSAITSSQTVSGMVTVPSTASLGLHSMRVVLEQTTSAAGVIPCGTYSYGETEDYQVYIQPPFATDAGVVSILSPTGSMLENSLHPVEVVVYNFGTDPISSMDVVYTVNGVNPVTTAYVGNLPSFSYDTVSLGDVAVPGGAFELCAFTDLLNDSSALNDGTCVQLFADPQYNLAMLSVDAPLGGCAQGMEDVVVTFTNIGDTIFGNLPLYYNDSSLTAPVMETYTGTVLPGDTVTYTFTTQIDLTVTSFTEFYIFAWLAYTGDPISANDSAMIYITSDISPPPPSADDITVWAGTSGTLNVNNPDSTLFYEWFDEMNVSLSTDTFYETPLLFDTTTYYLQASSGSLEPADITTTFAAGNGQTGTMMDVTAFTDLTLDSFYVNPQSTGLMEVWYKQGTYDGFQSNQSAWTLLGSANVNNPGTNIPALLSVGGLEIPAGETYGIYITFVSGSVSYTNGNGTNQVYQDDNIKIECGYGGSYFSLTFTPRVWNGTIFYTAGAPGCGSSLVPVTANVEYADYDAALVAITSPVSSSNLNNVAVTVDVYNNGLLPLDTIPVQYTINNGTPVVDTIIGPLAPGAMMSYTFTDSVNASVFGTYDICAKTLVLNDGYATNDEFCTSFANWDGNGESCATAFPYLLINDPPVYQTTVHPYDRQWWRFELPVDASDVYVSLCGSTFDTRLEVHSDCPQSTWSTSSYLGYNDNSCGQQSEIHFNNMSAGTYWAKVYGTSTSFGDYVLEITGTLDAISVATFNVTDIDCNGAANGSIQTTVAPIIPGATLPLSYLWSTGDTVLNLSNLAPGTYTLTITDATGIPQVESVTITEPPLLEVSLVGTDATTLGGNDGTIIATVTGGVTPYTYMWSNGATNDSIMAAYAGVYTLSVWDANGCTTEQTITINSPLPPGWVVTPTNNSHLIIVDQNSNITLDNVAAAYGSLIGLFYNSNGIMVCAGWAYWSGMATSVTAYGAEPPLDNGYQPGENFQWRLYEAGLNVEYGGPACYIASYPNQGTYVTGGFSGIDCINAQSIVTQSIALPFGWSIWSTYIDPISPAMTSLFSSISSDVTIVKSGTGGIYWPQYGLNTIGNLVMGQGYQIKMSVANTLDVTGLLIDPILNPITIPNGWSIMAYMRTAPMNTVTVMSPIVSSIVIVKSGNGLIYWPIYGLNTIGNMLPGQGYQIKMSQQESLTFPANTSASSKSNVYVPSTEKYNDVSNTGHNMSLGILEDAWNSAPKEGDEIGVFNTNGELIGSTVYQNGFNAITLWGDDSHTEDITEGIATGDVFTLRLWNYATDTEQELVVQSWLQGNNQYGKDAIAVIEKLVVVDSEYDGFKLFQNVPNPFKDATEISFYLPEASQVKLVVYNSLGEKIEEVVSARYEAGKHSVVFQTNGLSSGTYYYNFVSEKFTETKVMNIQ